MDIPFDIFGAPACTPQHVKKRWPEFYQYLQDHYSGLKFAEQIYWFSHNITECPKCIECGNPTSFINYNKGYREYCSIKCQSHSSKVREKTKQTCLERYGDTNYNNREKTKQTCLERYGVEYSFKREDVREKIKQTCIDKYEGVGFASKTLNEKGKQTCLERYGCENYNNAEKGKQTKLLKYRDANYNNRKKSKQTTVERYGVDNVFQADQFKEKSRKTMLKKYGVEYTQQSKELKEKCKDTLMKHYGVDHQSKSKEVINKITKNNRDRYLKLNDDLLGYTDNGDWICKCPHEGCSKCCEKQYIINSINYFARKEFKIEPCTHIRPIQPATNKDTSLEIFIQKLLDEYNIEYQTNDRKLLNGLELDIYIPSRQIAIECNGLFFHSAKIKDNKYHINKYVLCKENGVQLITLWEDQILYQSDIVKSLILSKLGIYKEIIGARQCCIREIDPHTCAEFLNTNHIQGETKTNIRLGLYHNDDLVAVMTFSKKSKLSGSKQMIEGEWELTRFCNKLNISITGGFAKLLKYFKDNYNPKIISSFASNDISNGDIYRKNGFEEDNHITSAYWYIQKSSYIRYHRSSFTKDRLEKMGYDIKNKTESEIMDNLPYYKIYDSGHTKYTLNFC